MNKQLKTPHPLPDRHTTDWFAETPPGESPSSSLSSVRKILPQLFMGLLCLFFTSLSFAQANTSEADQALLDRVFGESGHLDLAFHKQVLEATPGLRHYRDTDNDGQPDEIWYIDLAQRHPEKYRPLLVKVIDEDQDLKPGEEGDLDSDLYLADWNADGRIDSAVDYTDLDQDQDVDEMGIYFLQPKNEYFKEAVLRSWWGRDEGDDNLLWFDIAYTYDQALCENRCHFGGDEIFVAFALPLSSKEWIPYWENPFVFFDHDGDGATEEVVRFCGIDRDIENIRHSLDADNDTNDKNPRDYDVSISGWAPGSRLADGSKGPGSSLLKFEPASAEKVMLRGIPTGWFVSKDKTLDLVPRLNWVLRQLVWDEIDNNADNEHHLSSYERWEGVIAPGTAFFPQIGGPNCGLVNVRIEVDLDKAEAPIVYYHPVDHRIHLVGADHAWMEIDTNFDDKADMRYDSFDENKDGILDRWTLDTNLDGKSEDSWQASASVQATTLPFSWKEVYGKISERTRTIEALSLLDRTLSVVLAGMDQKGSFTKLGAEKMFSILSAPTAEQAALRRKLVQSDESLFFMLTASCDYQLSLLKQQPLEKDLLDRIEEARSSGEIDTIRQALENAYHLETPAEDFSAWKEHVQGPAPKQVAWNDKWFPPNVGWESEKVAYRSYWGQFDFFGKNQDILIYPQLSGENYHVEQPWGIDALHVGETAGCGGITLVVDGVEYPVRSPRGEGKIQFSHRLVEETPEKVVIEMKATPVGPESHPYTVTFRCTSQAGHPETDIEVTLSGGSPGAKASLAIELTRLNQEGLLNMPKYGVLATRGWQAHDIGWIGMSIIYPAGQFERLASQEDCHQVILSTTENQPIRYSICCDWLNGRRFNRCPSLQDWFDEILTIAGTK